MDFWVGIFVLAYGVAGLWALIAHDHERRKDGLRPGEPQTVPVRSVDYGTRG